jgi:hypothetical protein
MESQNLSRLASPLVHLDRLARPQLSESGPARVNPDRFAAKGQYQLDFDIYLPHFLPIVDRARSN